MASHWKAVLGIILIFIFGFLSGVFCSSIYAHQKMAAFLKHPAMALMAAMERKLTKNLDLDAQQKEQIHGYFMENLRQHKLLQAQIQPQVQVLNETTVKQITAALHPDQQDRFSKNLDDLHQRFWKYATSPDAGAPADPAAPSNVIGTNTGTMTQPAH